MKLLLAKILVLTSLSSFCQSGQIAGQIMKQDTLLEYKYLTVLLTIDDSTIKGTVPDTAGFFKLKNINKGIYSLKIRYTGKRDLVSNNLQIFSDTTICLNLSYPPPCGFVYRKWQKPKCIKGHTNHIIPIVYGLPTKKTMLKAKKGLVHLAGCTMTDCDPHYYCTVHNVEL